MSRILIVLSVFSIVGFFESAEAQVFGSRSIRRNLNRQVSNNAGMVQGNERFIRGRRRNSFVGADQAEMTGFVGNEQARTSGRIASPTGGLKAFVDRSSTINRVIPGIRKSDFYPASIQIPLDLLAATNSPGKDAVLAEALNREIRIKVSESIEVLVANRFATLRGEVASANQKSLAELLIRFEPGIDEIRNEIEVVGR